MKRSESVWVWSVFKAGVLVLLAAAALDGTTRAGADGPPPETPPPDDPVPVEDIELHVPNTLYPDGPGAIPIETLPPEQQAGIELAGERSDYGAAVHSAWSQAVTHPQAAEAKVEKAAHQSGTNGLDTVGVGP